MNPLKRAQVAVSQVNRGIPTRQAIQEMMDGDDDHLAALVGQSSGSAASALTGYGYSELADHGQSFESGEVKVYSNPSGEEPATTACVYLALQGGKVVSYHSEGSVNLAPEVLSAQVHSLAKQWGFVLADDSGAQPPSGAVGQAATMA